MNKHKNTIKDPYAAREAEKYDHPIPSREYIIQYLDEYGRPITFEDLIAHFGLNEEEQQSFRYRLRAMMRDGQLLRDRRNRFCLVKRIELIPGYVIGHPDGYGFVHPDAGGEDLYISAKQMRHVFPGDRVLAREYMRDKRGRREGIIHEVIEHNTQQLVGRIFIENGLAFVEPEHKRVTQIISVPIDQRGDAKHGQIVVVEIMAQPSEHKQAVGRVVEVLGDHMAPGMEIDVAIRAYDLPHQWSETVLDEISSLQPILQPHELTKRTDLRHLSFVTIDGEDAQDFDDAVYCEPLEKGGWRLFVAIADVSHYVKEQTALDQEAYQRGNSVYFPGRVIPMLPEILANELCSLKPQVDRLSMVCEMTVSADGKLNRSRFYPAVIHSHARLTYTEVAAVLQQHDPVISQQYEQVIPHLNHLYDLYKILYLRRQERGAVELDSTETRIIFGEQKKIKKIIPTVRNDAHRLIEECMLLANVSAARFLKRNKIMGLYRIHEAPAETKLVAFREFLSELGLQLKGGKKPKPQDYSELLATVRGRPDAHLIQTVLLRSFSQAQYSPNNIGHFGLAFSEYSHFTSPIRRYPDLLTHRAINHILTHESPEDFPYDQLKMENLGVHCSSTERRADEATRDAVNWLKCEYMLDHVGESFSGVISAVTSFGLFVELRDVYVEGLVHVTALANDYYHFDPVKHRLRGERTATTYRLGDPIEVLVARVNLDDRKIDFELA